MSEPIDRNSPQARRNRWLLLAIFALFFGSLLLAGVLRFSGWQPPATASHGDLLQPAADLRAHSPRLLDSGEAYAWPSPTRSWRILAAPPADCGAECATLARDLDVVWRLMGKDADRVDVLWLCPDDACRVPAPLADDRSLRRLRPDAALRAALPAGDATRTGGGTPVYLVDPNGFVVLRYPPGSDPGGLRADLAKLLKLM